MATNDAETKYTKILFHWDAKLKNATKWYNINEKIFEYKTGVEWQAFSQRGKKI